MIAGGLVTAICMLTIGSLYATEASSTDGGGWSIIVLIYIFIVGYSSSWAIVTRIICSEIQPMRTRAAATSLGQCANWVSKINLNLAAFGFPTEDFVVIGHQLGYCLQHPFVPRPFIVRSLFPLRSLLFHYRVGVHRIPP